MGCWKGTCTITHLPINWEDEAVGIALKPKKDLLPDLGGGYCYSTDAFQLFPIPIYGRYNDGGSLEKVTPDKHIEKITGKAAKNFVKYCERSEETNSRGKYCLCLIRRKVWDFLISRDISKHSWSDDEYGKMCLDDQVKYVIKEIIDLTKLPEAERMFEKDPIKRKLFGVGSSPDYEFMPKHECMKIIENTLDEKLIRNILSLKKINSYMEILRRGWYPQFGAGSQSNLVLEHRDLANFMLDEIQSYITKVEKENGEPYTDWH